MKFWNAWVELWTEEEGAQSLAAFRIAIGLIVVFDTLSMWAAGVIDPLYIPFSEGGLAPGDRFPSLMVQLVGHSTETTWALSYAMFGLGLLSVVGLGGRLTQFALLQVVLAWHAIPLDIGGGYDRLLTNALFLLCLGPCTATWSLDSRLRTGSFRSDQLIWALPRRLAIFQLVLVYTSTGWVKTGPGWHPTYEGVFRALQLQTWARFGELPWLGWLWVPLLVGTAVALWWERLFGLILVFYAARRGLMGAWAERMARFDARWIFLGIGVLVHGILAIFTNLGTFSSVTLAFYLAFARPDEWPERWRRTGGV